MGDVRQPDVRVTMIDNDRVFVDAVLRYCAQLLPPMIVSRLDVGQCVLDQSESGVRHVVTLDPDQLVDADGIVSSMCAADDRVSVIALTMCADSAVAVRLARAGCVGWVGKDEPITALVDTIDAVCHGAARFPVQHLAGVMRMLADRAPAQPCLARTGRTLSKREREILGHMLTGASSTDIAKTLHLSANTIRSHRRRIGAKLGVGI
jgi:DNA-binding NarL/FixJ family response regulator